MKEENLRCTCRAEDMREKRMNSTIHYHRIYEKHGAVAPEEILENDIWIDVGNGLREGVFDHHQAGGERSAFAAIILHGEYLNRVRAYVDDCRKNGQTPSICFHIHRLPDADCLMGMYAVEKMFERGAPEPAAAFRKETLDVLLDYINQTDGGKQKNLSELTLYAYLGSVANELPEGQEKNECIYREGIRVLQMNETVLDQNAAGTDLFNMPIDQYLDPAELPYYSVAQEKLKREAELYRQDKKTNTVIFRMVKIWNRKTGQPETVKAGIWLRESAGSSGYIYARAADGCMLTVMPMRMIGNETEPDRIRTIIALNPNRPEAEKLTLRPLAEILDRLSRSERKRNSAGSAYTGETTAMPEIKPAVCRCRRLKRQAIRGLSHPRKILLIHRESVR